jgi:hypothetical protein
MNQSAERKLYLICNAHIDPVWLWNWEEGLAETLSTFRTAARFCEESGDRVFCHTELGKHVRAQMDLPTSVINRYTHAAASAVLRKTKPKGKPS